MVQFRLDPVDVKRFARGVKNLASAVRVEVEADRRSYSPGDDIGARLRIRALRDCTVNGGTAALVHVWGFESTFENRTQHFEYPKPAQTTLLTIGGTLSKGDILERSFTLRVPANPTPSGRGSTIWSRWEVAVEVSLPGADARGRCPIIVFCAPEEHDSVDVPGDGRCSGCELVVEAAPRVAVPGGAVTGRVKVRADEELSARRLLLRLERTEKVDRPSHKVREKSGLVELILAEPFEDLRPNEERWFTFELAVPPESCPSMASPEFEIGWRLVAELDRKFRKDDEYELPLRVVSAPPSTVPSAALTASRPVEPAAETVPARPKVKPAWYLLAALLTVCCLAAAGSALILFFGAVHDLQRVVVPGEGTLQLEEQQDYTIFLEWESEIDGTRYEFPGDSATTETSLTGPDGEPVELSEPDSETNYSVGPFWGNSIYEFTSGPAGTYLLEATFTSGETEPKLVLAVDLGNFVAEGLVAGFTAFALFLGASATWFRIFRMRRRIKQIQPAAESAEAQGE